MHFSLINLGVSFLSSRVGNITSLTFLDAFSFCYLPTTFCKRKEKWGWFFLSFLFFGVGVVPHWPLPSSLYIFWLATYLQGSTLICTLLCLFRYFWGHFRPCLIILAFIYSLVPLIAFGHPWTLIYFLPVTLCSVAALPTDWGIQCANFKFTPNWLEYCETKISFYKHLRSWKSYL